MESYQLNCKQKHSVLLAIALSSSFFIKSPTHIFYAYSYPRNDNVNASNEAKLKEIPFKSYVWEAEDWEPAGGQLKTLIRNCLAPKQLFLKRNAQVMLIKNFTKDLVNGKRGIVVGF